jgi:predicted nucleotidyltransferase
MTLGIRGSDGEGEPRAADVDIHRHDESGREFRVEEVQIAPLVDGVHDVLREDLVGVYLHGSAVLDGLHPHSDIDVIVVSKRRATSEEKGRLVDLLLALSGWGRSIGRPIELDVVVQSEIRPWRYPPAFDFHFSELLRKDFESGELEPWSTATKRDLASVITMTLLGDTALFGLPPVEIFDPVPRRDYIDAILRDTRTVDQYLDWDTRNVVLTLPRIWSAVATDEMHSKDSAATWALSRLPVEHRPVLERVQSIYRGEARDSWDDLLPQVRAYADYIVSEINEEAVR